MINSCIWDKEINESAQQKICSIAISSRNELQTTRIRLDNTTFPRSPNLGIVNVLFNGTIFDFEVTNFVTKFPHLETDLKYTTAA